MSAPRSLAIVGLLALIAGCTSSTAPSTGGGGGGGGACTGTNANVAVCDNHFNPTGSTITNGSTIVWTFKGASQHNVTFTGGPVAITGSSNMSTGTFSHTFTTPGAYTYECSIHGAVMSGTVQVN